jgi:hypothetical protein
MTDNQVIMNSLSLQKTSIFLLNNECLSMWIAGLE